MIDPFPPGRDPALASDEAAPFTWIDWTMLAVAIACLAAILPTEAPL